MNCINYYFDKNVKCFKKCSDELLQIRYTNML